MKCLLLLCTLLFCIESTNVSTAKLPNYAQTCFEFVDPKHHKLAYEDTTAFTQGEPNYDLNASLRLPRVKVLTPVQTKDRFARC
ncbi:hypothetical protein Y032_0222g2600 [Ancylostoma ceylanicum]|uniref:Uncharacterized protein n=1 Tax=Ancylostoma ceylanicum TaxID=53326 RepID=A0A016SHV6_9BILA|nr:hypothetical protein Y032_0222g2600 [Ancylostoma ceylanicum]